MTGKLQKEREGTKLSDAKIYNTNMVTLERESDPLGRQEHMQSPND